VQDWLRGACRAALAASADEALSWARVREEAFPASQTNDYRHLRVADFSDTVSSLPPEELQVGYFFDSAQVDLLNLLEKVCGVWVGGGGHTLLGAMGRKPKAFHVHRVLCLWNLLGQGALGAALVGCSRSGNDQIGRRAVGAKRGGGAARAAALKCRGALPLHTFAVVADMPAVAACGRRRPVVQLNLFQQTWSC
jgi:hypothetical protein